MSRKLEALDDFDDDAFDIEGSQNKSYIMSSNRLSQLVTQKKKPKVRGLYINIFSSVTFNCYTIMPK